MKLDPKRLKEIIKEEIALALEGDVVDVDFGAPRQDPALDSYVAALDKSLGEKLEAMHGTGVLDISIDKVGHLGDIIEEIRILLGLSKEASSISHSEGE